MSPRTLARTAVAAWSIAEQLAALAWPWVTRRRYDRARGELAIWHHRNGAAWSQLCRLRGWDRGRDDEPVPAAPGRVTPSRTWLVRRSRLALVERDILLATERSAGLLGAIASTPRPRNGGHWS